MIEAQGKLFDIQRDALALQSENQQLRAEIEKFRSTRFHHSVNWWVLSDGSDDGPFCPVCAGEGVEMRLTLRGSYRSDGAALAFALPQGSHSGRWR